MTLDEAINRERRKAEEQRSRIGTHDKEYSKKCEKWDKEHEQYVEWLEEVKSYRASLFSGEMTQAMLKEERNNAIDIFYKIIKNKLIFEYANSTVTKQYMAMKITELCKEIKERLEKDENMFNEGTYILNPVPPVAHCKMNETDKDVGCNRWIPISERLPNPETYVLLSFENFSIPVIGIYEQDKDGGAFYAGDEDETLTSKDMYVNAWMPLPEPYRESEKC